MKFMFNLFAFLYIVSPLIVIPYWAYLNDNWYLLLGILFSWFASYTTFSPKFKGFIFLYTFLCIGIWVKISFSIHQYITFFFFCSLGGYLFAKIAEEYSQESKKGTLENDLEFMDFYEKNPEYLQKKMEEWVIENPDKQLTYEAIDSLAKGKKVRDSDLTGETINQMTEKFLKKYIASNPPELKRKINKWENQNPDKEITEEIIYELAANKNGTLRNE